MTKITDHESLQPKRKSRKAVKISQHAKAHHVTLSLGTHSTIQHPAINQGYSLQFGHIRWGCHRTQSLALSTCPPNSDCVSPRMHHVRSPSHPPSSKASRPTPAGPSSVRPLKYYGREVPIRPPGGAHMHVKDASGRA